MEEYDSKGGHCYSGRLSVSTAIRKMHKNIGRVSPATDCGKDIW